MNTSQFNARLEENTIAAHKALRTLETKSRDLQDERLRLEHSIAKNLQDLAVIELNAPEFDDENIQRDLAQRSKVQADLLDLLHDVEAQIGETKKSRDSYQWALEAEQSALSARITADPKSSAIQAVAAQARSAFEAHKATSEEIQEECHTKLASFTSPVYDYLKAREFGTDQYTATGIAKHLDSWIARVYKFQANRANEELLIAMRTHVIEELTRLEKAAELADEALLACMTEMERDSRIGALRTQISQLDSTRQRLKKSAKELQGSLQTYASQTDPHFTRIRNALATRLGQASIATLNSMAIRTQTQADDAAVKELEESKKLLLLVTQQLVKELEESKKLLLLVTQQLAQMNDSIEQARGSYRRAKELESNFEMGSWTSNRIAYSPGLDLDNLIAGYMLGSLSLSAFGSSVRSYQREMEVTPPAPRYTSHQETSNWRASPSRQGDSVFSRSTPTESVESSSSNSSDYETSDSF